jgi:DNA-binding NarL/FixJ family response regulator
MCMNNAPTTVLVIDSHPMMREALCSAIAKDAELQVAEQSTNTTGISQMAILIKPDAILLTFKPDIILLSVGNPGANELEALGILQKSLPDTLILALTTNEVPGQEQVALTCGAEAVLTKAAPCSELIRSLRELRTRVITHYSEKY